MVETATINGTELAYIERGQGQPVDLGGCQMVCVRGRVVT